MEIDEALEFCLRRLRTEPERLLRLAQSLTGPADGPEGALPPPSHCRAGAGEANRAVLQLSQEVLAETITRLDRDNS